MGYRLTPSRIRGVQLPSGKPINRTGMTSLLYADSDPEYLLCYTLEQMKLEWWLRGLNIIDDYDYLGEVAHFEGYAYTRFLGGEKWVRYNLPLYVCRVPFLKPLAKQHKRRLKEILVLISEARRGDAFMQQWDALTELSLNKVPEIRQACEFVYDYEIDKIAPDFGFDDWRLVNDEMVCIDPYHHEAVSDIYWMHRYPANQSKSRLYWS